MMEPLLAKPQKIMYPTTEILVHPCLLLLYSIVKKLKQKLAPFRVLNPKWSNCITPLLIKSRDHGDSEMERLQEWELEDDNRQSVLCYTFSWTHEFTVVLIAFIRSAHGQSRQNPGMKEACRNIILSPAEELFSIDSRGKKWGESWFI